MFRDKILLFGYGNHGKFIAKGLQEDGFNVKVVESNEIFYTEALNDGFDHAVLIDVTKDEALQELNPINYVQLVCVMDDEHLNVFLTLSLRSLFADSYILSISDSIHTTKKLQMAGANKVIDLYEVSANKIHNILNRPIATKLLEEFVIHKNGIGFREMTIPEDSFLLGIMTDDIDFSPFGVLLVGMIDVELGNNFIFITAGVNHKIDAGDTIVCIGEKKKLDDFEILMKEKEILQDAE
jgi:voltage-gated potassium channel